MSTRSRSKLSGTLRDYLLETRMNNTNTGGEQSGISGDGGVNSAQGGVTDQQQLAALLGRVAGDPSQLCAILAQSLSSVSESNRQLQELLTQQPQVRQGTHFKLEECPKKRKYCTLEAWTEEVSLWNDGNKVPDTDNAKKYLKFVEAVRNSEEAEDLKNLVQVEFVENANFDKKSTDVIKKMLDTIK